MKKGKLILSFSTDRFKLTRIFFNPWDKESDREISKEWNAYEGSALYFRTGKSSPQFKLLDDKGRDISSKVKNDKKDWHQNALPYTEEMRKERNKSNKNFFGKVKEFVDYNPVASFSTAAKNSDKIIATTVKQSLEGIIKKDGWIDFFNLLIHQGRQGKKNADIAIDQWSKGSKTICTVEYEIEYNDKFDFDKLFFFTYPWSNYGILKDLGLSKNTSLIGAIVYEGVLYHGQISLEYPDTFNSYKMLEVITSYSQLTDATVELIEILEDSAADDFEESQDNSDEDVSTEDEEDSEEEEDDEDSDDDDKD